MLQSRNGWSVAHGLALSHPEWTTDDPEILDLANKYGETVKDILREKIKFKHIKRRKI